MIVNFKSRNIEITNAMKDYAEKRLSKFDKIIDGAEATVTMRTEKDRHRLEVTIFYNGLIIRGEEEGYDMYACIDEVTEKLESQLHKYRTRLQKRSRGVKIADAVAEPEWVEDDKPVRVKTFSTKPMTVEEAVMEMNLIGHGFYVFLNAEDQNQVNVVYRRKDRDYGLLVPEK